MFYNGNRIGRPTRVRFKGTHTTVLQELSYRKQIARKLRIGLQYVEGI